MKHSLRFLLLLPLMLLLLCGLTGSIFLHPDHTIIPPEAEPLFAGVYYLRDERAEPFPLVSHIIFIDLETEDLSFLVTPGNPDAEYQLAARPTTQFLSEFGLQLAINGGDFSPWHYNSPTDYYPLPGNPVNAIGLAASQGQIYAPFNRQKPTLFISSDNHVQFLKPSGDIYNALSGQVMILYHGRVSDVLGSGGFADRHPRTAVALDRAGTTLMLFVVDGRRHNYSWGLTLKEMALLIASYGGYDAINLDGGGSSTLVIEDGGEQPAILNATVHAGAPRYERAVGNHLGVYALPLSDDTDD